MVNWLDSLSAKARQKCLARLQRLEELGRELRRPEADYLGGDVYELRASYQGVHHRILYFFQGRTVVIVSHGCEKERDVPQREIDLAKRRKKLFEFDPKRHSFRP